MAARRKVSRTTMWTGPFKGVFNTREPFDARPEYLVDAKNGYLPDPGDGSGFYARPGFRLLFGGDAVVVSAAQFRGQEVYSHTMLDGSTINFFVMAGKLFRVDAGLNTATDVSPVGITINADVTTRVFFVSEAGAMAVTDGVNRPWVASDLTTTPITGTYISYDGTGVTWSIYGAPRIYLGAMFGILNQVNGVSRRADVSWSEPGLFATGWQQTDFDNNMTPSQNEGGNIYALISTELGLYYFRGTSIGSISGSNTGTLQSTATSDAIAFNIGAQASQTLRKFGNGFFFCDAQGRPYFYEPGRPPEPIWKQMRSVVEDGSAAFPITTSIVATSTIEPTLNKYLVAIYSANPSTQAPPTKIHVFDAQTRTYEGFLEVAPGIAVECLGIFFDSSGRATLIILGSKLEAPAVGGYVWAFNALAEPHEDLTTEAGVILTTEGGVTLTTEGQEMIWGDNGEVPDIYAMSDRLGYSEDVVYNVDQVTVITGNDAPVRVSIVTASTVDTVEGIPEPSASQDGTYRLVVGCDIFGRGPQVTVKPLTADSQWILHRIAISARPSLAGPEDA